MQSETLVEEFSRLVREYKQDDGPGGVEAWNLIADFAVDNAEAIEAALSAAEPVSRRNDEAGYIEFLNQDAPYVIRDIQGAVAILMDLETRNVIGYRVYDPDSVFAPQPTTDRYKPLQSENATKPVAWVYAADLEKGDGCFGNAKGEVCMSRDGKWIKVDTPLYAAPPALSAQVQDVATHRHKKRGTEYVLIGIGKMQAENWQVSVDGFDQSIDMQEVAVYRSVDDGSLWVRPVEEFNDGRFEPLPVAPAKQEDGHD